MSDNLCRICESAESSHSKKPFVPPRGSVNSGTYVCECGQRWWQYNAFYHLWSKISSDDDETWRNVRGGCREGPVCIGVVSANLYR